MEKEIFTISVLLAFVFNKTGAQDISDLLDGYDAYNRYRGNILVAQNGKIILQQSFGYADKDRDYKNDSSTLFNLASVTKTITAAAIFKLHDEGRLNVFDRGDKYIPGFINDETDSITIINLLNQTSGVEPSGRVHFVPT